MSFGCDSVVQELADIRLASVFNPYSDRCETFDRNDAPQMRCANLRAVLERAVEMSVRTVWIARDLGHRGGRRTGLALTDEVHLEACSAMFGGLQVSKATEGPPMAEQTAAIIWRMLERVGQPVFLWNVFPFHPHSPESPFSNRRHTAEERRIGERFLRIILELLDPEAVVALGADAHAAAGAFGVACTRVRHPSYGGRNVFVGQIEAAYGLSEFGEGSLLADHS